MTVALNEAVDKIDEYRAKVVQLEAADAERLRIRELHKGPGGWMPRHAALVVEVYNQRWRDAFNMAVDHLKTHKDLWKEHAVKTCSTCHLPSESLFKFVFV